MIGFINLQYCSLFYSVAVLNPEFLQLPIQAIHCSLANVTHPDKNKDKFIKKFHNMVIGKELLCRSDKCEDGIHHVLIIDSSEGDGTNVNEELAVFISGGGKGESDGGML